MVRPCWLAGCLRPPNPPPRSSPRRGLAFVPHTVAQPPTGSGARPCDHCHSSVAPQPLLCPGVASEDSFRGRRAHCSTLASGLLRCAHGAGCHLTRSNSAFRG